MDSGWVTDRKRKSCQEKKNNASSAQKQTRANIKKYVEDCRKKLKSGQESMSTLKRGIARNKAKLQGLTGRHHHHERLATEKRIKELERQLADMGSGVNRELSEFDVMVQPYIDMHDQMQEAAKKAKPAKEVAVAPDTTHASIIRDELMTLMKEDAPELSIIRVQNDMCDTCEEAMVVMASEARMGCPVCSRTKPYMQATSAQIPYGEEVEFSSFSYKRKNHLRERLNVTQAKENAEVPIHVINRVMEHLHSKLGVRSKDKITTKHIRQSLRELEMRGRYEHTMQIFVSITGKRPPRLTTFQEDQLCLMFDAMQAPFKKHQPEDRKNFLSYPHCLHKFCQILGYDHLLPYFPLLKGKEKCKKQDEIFKKICVDLDWEFIASDDNENTCCATLEDFIAKPSPVASRL